MQSFITRHIMFIFIIAVSAAIAGLVITGSEVMISIGLNDVVPARYKLPNLRWHLWTFGFIAVHLGIYFAWLIDFCPERSGTNTFTW